MRPPKGSKAAKGRPAGSAKKAAKGSKKRGGTGGEAGGAAGGAAGAGPSAPAVWRPGQDGMEEDEALQYDPTAYDCLHRLALEWPCLSFDVLPDELGAPRSAFPHSLLLAAGTQAATAGGNSVTLLKLSNLTQGRHGSRAAHEDSEDESSSSDEDDDAPPVLHLRALAHAGGVNRLRAMPQQPGIIAAWADTGAVQVFDAVAQLADLAAAPDARAARGKPLRQAPRQAHAHPVEGFALDWSRVAPGRLATGDCAGAIHVWEPTDKGGWLIGGAHQGHEGSVEDVQWSPSEGTVFASASVDRSIRVWDTRARGPQLTARRCCQHPFVAAHEADVNVISWNRLAAFMMASGGDDGTLRVWDLRSFAAGAHVASFAYHKGAVTSVEWCPAESSMLATTSADGSAAVWDLALERDPEEEAAAAAAMNAAAPDDLPPQLLFVHGGQGDLKEAHWHPQIPGMLITTAADGFNVFKPSNVP